MIPTWVLVDLSSFLVENDLVSVNSVEKAFSLEVCPGSELGSGGSHCFFGGISIMFPIAALPYFCLSCLELVLNPDFDHHEGL